MSAKQVMSLAMTIPGTHSFQGWKMIFLKSMILSREDFPLTGAGKPSPA